MSSFRITGDETHASIEVIDMSPGQVAEGLKHALVMVYERSGQDINGDDLTLLNIVMGELHDSLEEVAAIRKNLRRARWMLYAATALNVGIAWWNLTLVMAH